MTTDNASQDARQPTVGERLRQAREVAGLSVAEVANKQHLRPAIISAIESGDYGRIDSELFLKGYVRAYATHVGIDPESVIRQLDKELEPLRQEQKARVEASPLVDIERRKRRKRRIAKVVLLLVAAVVVFYAGSLYLADGDMAGPATVDEADESMAGSDNDVSESAALSGDTSEETAVPSTNDVDSETSSIGAGSDDSLSNGNAISREEIPEGDEPSAADALDGTGSESSLAGETIGRAPGTEPPSTVSAESASDPEVAEDTGSAPLVTSAPLPETDPAPPVDSEGRLVMEFSGDCWVEVQDSTGRTLVAELRRAGETLDVNGESPLRVVIGAVSAVSDLRYSGETVDLASQRPRNDRLVLNLSD
ncbi:RodZ domain-containing protein [Marinobacter sp. LN3S78]|uniref:RodZ domain-containing protein n=1 Tax=Marinobacter sp. LN3S78 TaxID=3382300 RepID=UPI00387A9F6F